MYYYLSPERVKGTVPRSDRFRADVSVITGSAQLSDFKGSGYDRGHLCPAADNKHTKEAMLESFFMSNMSPQVPSFNRGIWKQSEEQFREWALEREGIYVVTAGVLSDTLETIGENRVSIPDYYYKIAYSPRDSVMVGFLLSNEGTKSDLKEFMVPVDSIETMTGIDFFPQLEDEMEERLEGGACREKWFHERDKP